MSERMAHLLFDLDGTLTDPKEGIINSIVYALNKLEIPEDKLHELDGFIGPPLYHSFAARYSLSPEQATEAVTAYRDYFSVKGLFENSIYPGIPEVLEKLRAHNYRLFVATSKPTVFAEQILRHFKLDRYFESITGSNLDNTRTDKTEVIAHVLHLHGLQVASCVMIGDRKHDIIGGKNHGMKTMGVSYGYGSREELEAEQPDFIAADCKSIFTLLAKE